MPLDKNKHLTPLQELQKKYPWCSALKIPKHLLNMNQQVKSFFPTLIMSIQIRLINKLPPEISNKHVIYFWQYYLEQNALAIAHEGTDVKS